MTVILPLPSRMDDKHPRGRPASSSARNVHGSPTSASCVASEPVPVPVPLPTSVDLRLSRDGSDKGAQEMASRSRSRIGRTGSLQSRASLNSSLRRTTRERSALPDAGVRSSIDRPPSVGSGSVRSSQLRGPRDGSAGSGRSGSALSRPKQGSARSSSVSATGSARGRPRRSTPASSPSPQPPATAPPAPGTGTGTSRAREVVQSRFKGVLGDDTSMSCSAQGAPRTSSDSSPREVAQIDIEEESESFEKEPIKILPTPEKTGDAPEERKRTTSTLDNVGKESVARESTGDGVPQTVKFEKTVPPPPVKSIDRCSTFIESLPTDCTQKPLDDSDEEDIAKPIEMDISCTDGSQTVEEPRISVVLPQAPPPSFCNDSSITSLKLLSAEDKLPTEKTFYRSKGLSGSDVSSSCRAIADAARVESARPKVTSNGVTVGSLPGNQVRGETMGSRHHEGSSPPSKSGGLKTPGAAPIVTPVTSKISRGMNAVTPVQSQTLTEAVSQPDDKSVTTNPIVASRAVTDIGAKLDSDASATGKTEPCATDLRGQRTSRSCTGTPVRKENEEGIAPKLVQHMYRGFSNSSLSSVSPSDLQPTNETLPQDTTVTTKISKGLFGEDGSVSCVASIVPTRTATSAASTENNAYAMESTATFIISQDNVNEKLSITDEFPIQKGRAFTSNQHDPRNGTMEASFLHTPPSTELALKITDARGMLNAMSGISDIQQNTSDKPIENGLMDENESEGEDVVVDAEDAGVLNFVAQSKPIPWIRDPGATPEHTSSTETSPPVSRETAAERGSVTDPVLQTLSLSKPKEGITTNRGRSETDLGDITLRPRGTEQETRGRKLEGEDLDFMTGDEGVESGEEEHSEPENLVKQEKNNESDYATADEEDDLEDESPILEALKSHEKSIGQQNDESQSTPHFQEGIFELPAKPVDENIHLVANADEVLSKREDEMPEDQCIEADGEHQPPLDHRNVKNECLPIHVRDIPSTIYTTSNEPYHHEIPSEELQPKAVAETASLSELENRSIDMVQSARSRINTIGSICLDRTKNFSETASASSRKSFQPDIRDIDLNPSASAQPEHNDAIHDDKETEIVTSPQINLQDEEKRSTSLLLPPREGSSTSVLKLSSMKSKLSTSMKGSSHSSHQNISDKISVKSLPENMLSKRPEVDSQHARASLRSFHEPLMLQIKSNSREIKKETDEAPLLNKKDEEVKPDEEKFFSGDMDNNNTEDYLKEKRKELEPEGKIVMEETSNGSNLPTTDKIERPSQPAPYLQAPSVPEGETNGLDRNPDMPETQEDGVRKEKSIFWLEMDENGQPFLSSVTAVSGLDVGEYSDIVAETIQVEQSSLVSQEPEITHEESGVSRHVVCDTVTRKADEEPISSQRALQNECIRNGRERPPCGDVQPSVYSPEADIISSGMLDSHPGDVALAFERPTIVAGQASPAPSTGPRVNNGSPHQSEERPSPASTPTKTTSLLMAHPHLAAIHGTPDVGMSQTRDIGLHTHGNKMKNECLSQIKDPYLKARIRFVKPNGEAVSLFGLPGEGDETQGSRSVLRKATPMPPLGVVQYRQHIRANGTESISEMSEASTSYEIDSPIENLTEDGFRVSDNEVEKVTDDLPTVSHEADQVPLDVKCRKMRRCSNCGEECVHPGAPVADKFTRVVNDSQEARRRQLLARAIEACERELGPLNDTLQQLQEKVRALQLPELNIPPRRSISHHLPRSPASPARLLSRSASSVMKGAVRSIQTGAGLGADPGVGLGAEQRCPYCGMQLVPESALSPLARMYILLAQPRDSRALRAPSSGSLHHP